MWYRKRKREKFKSKKKSLELILKGLFENNLSSFLLKIVAESVLKYIYILKKSKKIHKILKSCTY